MNVLRPSSLELHDLIFMIRELVAMFFDNCRSVYHLKANITNPNFKGGSPGLVVMGVDSRSKGRGFESRRRILDGHDIFHIHLL